MIEPLIAFTSGVAFCVGFLLPLAILGAVMFLILKGFGR